MRIALPSRSIFDRLGAGDVGEHTVIRAPQAECELLLRTARAELALISPLGYGSAPSLSDYHIVGTTCLVADENTALASIRFRSGLREPRTYYAPEPDDFLTTIGLLLLAEQHELRLKPSATLDGADTVIAWNDAGDFPDHPATIDLTEEWALACECSLPIGVWVCRSDLAEEFDVPSITTALAGDELQQREYLDSGGYLQWRWDDDVKAALATTLEMLYYHRYIPSLPKVKLL
ncbi:MAG: hypothetical protein KatS3mg040_1836 [Candidatus Kapaibacterium sp.]|nr:MAG: hypothetical protein KatS3mg040_0003 [Candidatus Kapabacteria bacterium]GIV57068.1 MAG: hypothetical protein KatS3mg040_1836 [Candidatus Kapabacteria bacterium]